MYLYVLLLEDRRYYIGRSQNPKIRIQSHVDGTGSFWTRKYKPSGLIENRKIDDPFEEDIQVLKYMERYGIDNVRGGSFSELVLSRETLSIIQKMIRGANDLCFKCGERGHFSNDCSQSLSELYLRETRFVDAQVQTEVEPGRFEKLSLFFKAFMSNLRNL